jgi:hypothetical protein
MAAPKLKKIRSNESAEAEVRKVAPYPFAVQITRGEGQPFMMGQIVKMTEIGFLMKVDGNQYYKVGEVYTVYFELPATRDDVSSAAKVIKTYDAVEIIAGQKIKIHTIEMHFKEIPDKERRHIHSYLVKSGQKKY